VSQDYLELSFEKKRSPSKKSIENLIKKVNTKFFIDYSGEHFKIRFKTELKKIHSDVKKVLHFF